MPLQFTNLLKTDLTIDTPEGPVTLAAGQSTISSALTLTGAQRKGQLNGDFVTQQVPASSVNLNRVLDKPLPVVSKGRSAKASTEGE